MVTRGGRSRPWPRPASRRFPRLTFSMASGSPVHPAQWKSRDTHIHSEQKAATPTSILQNKKPRHPHPFKFPTRFKADLPYWLHVVPSTLSPCLNPESVRFHSKTPPITTAFLVVYGVRSYVERIPKPVSTLHTDANG